MSQQGNSKMFTINFTSAPAYVPTVHTWEGKQYYVIPVVMMVEGVHNGSRGPLYHSAEELGKVEASWNGIPVTIGHPSTADGTFLSANSPDVLSSWAVGKVFNTRLENNKLKAEAWLDIEKLTAISPETLQSVEAGQIMEVSVGVFSDEEPVEGEWNGEHYIAIARNHRPDHLALLPGEIGACSVHDGCGLRVNNENMKGGSKNVALIIDDKLLKVLVEHNLSARLITQQEGMSAMLVKLQRLLDSKDNQNETHYLEEAYDSYVIFNKRDRAGSILYKQAYQENADGTVELVGEPVKVTRKVEYIVVQQLQRTNFNNKKGKSMCEPCKERVDELIAHEATLFTEDDRDWLEALTEDKLDKLIPRVNKTPAEPKAPTMEEAWNVIKAEAKPEDYISHLPEDVVVQINAEQKMKEERQNIIEHITAHSTDWAQDDLVAMPFSILKKLKTTLDSGAPNYVANAGGVRNLETGKKGITPMPLPGVKFE